MIPFMATQSLAMGEAFGIGFQYGKRRISAMTNEEFNKKSPSDIHSDMQAGVKEMIPQMKESMSNFTLLQVDIIKELINYVKVILAEVPSIVQDVTSSSGGDIGKIGQEIIFGLLKNITGQILPSAEARRGDTQITGNQDFLKLLEGLKFGASSSAGGIKEGVGAVTQLTKANRLAEEARVARAQAALEQRVLDAAKKEALLQKERDRQKVNLSKRKAGQSQIAERISLIKEIARLAKLEAQPVSTAVKQMFRTRIRSLQIALENLLARYIF